MTSKQKLTMLLSIIPLWFIAAIYDVNYWGESKRSWKRTQIELSNWRLTLKRDNDESYKAYLNRHPDGLHSIDAKNAIEKIEFEDATKTKSIRELNKFLQKKRSAAYISKAKQEIEVLEYNEAKVKNTTIAYNAFLEKYPDSQFAEEITTALPSLKLLENNKVYTDAKNLWLKFKREIKGRNGSYADIYGVKAMTKSVNKSKKSVKAVIPVLEVIIYKPIKHPTLIYTKNGIFFRANTKGKTKTISLDVKNIVTKIIKTKYIENKQGIERGCVLFLPERYKSRGTKYLKNIVNNLIDSAAIAVKQSEYKTQLLFFKRGLDYSSGTRGLVFDNGYTYKQARSIYTQKKRLLPKIINDKKKWSYASAYVFGKIVLGTNFFIDEKLVLEGVNDGVNIAPLKYRINDLLVVLIKYTNKKDAKKYGKRGKPKSLKVKGSHFQKVAYGLGYLYGSHITLNNSLVVASSAANGISHAISHYDPKVGIKLLTHKNNSLDSFIKNNAIFSSKGSK